MNKDITIIIFICLITLVVNYGMHVQIIHQDEKIRASAYVFVAKQCPSYKTNEWAINNDIFKNNTYNFSEVFKNEKDNINNINFNNISS